MTAGAGDLRVLQRVVFPGDDLDVVPRYIRRVGPAAEVTV